MNASNTTLPCAHYFKHDKGQVLLSAFYNQALRNYTYILLKFAHLISGRAGIRT